MSEKAITLDDIPVIKELVEDTIEENTAEMAASISEITPRILPPNARIVYCDGDHDEVKLQAAIDELSETYGGGVVYPVGDCVVTAENVYEARLEGASTIQYRAIIPIKEGITLDGSYCTITFKQLSVNTTAAKNCWVFYALGTMRNVTFTEEDCSYDTRAFNPTILYSDGANIEGCTFTDVWGGTPSSNRSRSTFNINNSLFAKNIIKNYTYRSDYAISAFAAVNSELLWNEFDGFSLASSSTSGSATLITIDSGCIVTGNTFKNIEGRSDTSLYGKWSANKILDCVFNGRVRLGGNFSLCEFSNLTFKDYIGIYGAMSECRFKSISASDKRLCFAVSNGGKLSGCTFDNITAYGNTNGYSDAYTLFNLVNGASVTNCSVTLSGECIMNYLSGDSTYNFALANVGAKCIFKDNTAGVMSFGTYDEDAVVKDNILATQVTGVVTLTSDTETITAGTKLTADVSNGENGNIEDIEDGEIAYIWQKSRNGTGTGLLGKWTNLDNGDGSSSSYTVVGTEKYIRCVVAVYGSTLYAGAVYSGAYAVTAAETTGTE